MANTKTGTGYPQVEDEENPKTKKSAIWGGVLSMLPTIAGTIPSLMKSKQTGALKAMQQGRGAGAIAARQAGSEAARRVAGNVQGANLREGLRTADKLTARGAATAGLIGAREGALATGQLMGEEQRRRGVGLQLGAGLGGTGASLIATLLAAKDQGPDLNAQKSGLAYEPPLVTSATPGGMTMQTPQEAGAQQNLQQQSFMQGAQKQLEGFQQKRMELQPPAPQGPPTAGSTTMQQSLAPQQPQAQQPSALSSMVTKATPEQRMKQGQEAYVKSVTKPSELPFTGASKGGSDQQYISQSTMKILEETLAGEIDKFERTGGAFGMSRERAEQLLNWYKSTGQMSDEVKRMLPGGVQ